MEQHNRLDSWKAISAYLNRTVRTCQRWERELALPVHRVHNKKRDMVFAYAQELDAWLNSGGGARALAEPRDADSGEVTAVAGETRNGVEHRVPGASANPLATIPAAKRDENAGDPPVTESGTRAAATRSASLGVPSEHGASIEGAASRRPAWLRRAAAVVLLMAGGATIAGLLREPLIRARAWFSPPAPESIRFEPNGVTAHDVRGQKLWTFPVGGELQAATYERNKQSDELPYAGVHDLDGDGRKEVLFVVRAVKSEFNLTFYCLNNDGSVRWTRLRDKAVRFGEQDYHPPFVPRGFAVTAEPNGTRTVWLTLAHQPEFPEVIEKLNHQGEVLAEFWHGGHLNALKEGQVNHRRVMFAGYVENDGRRASLAMLDYENPGGFAPAQSDYYRCTSCSAGQPLAFFIFPRLETARAFNSMPRVEGMLVGREGLQVTVRQTHPWNHQGLAAAGVNYKLDSKLSFVDAFHDVGHEQVHGHLEMTGVIKHKYSRSEESDLFPVLSWDGSKFVQIPAPPNFAAARKPTAPNRAKTTSAPVSVPTSPARATQPQ